MAETPRGPGQDLAPGPRFVPGAVLGRRFRIVALLGRGGMGEVYRAEDLRLQQSVALKFLPQGYTADEERLALLLSEVRLAREITHPSVCRVYDFFDLDETPCVAMEYVDGESLAALMRRIGRLPQAKALQIAHQVTRGLMAAHAKRILHRDLKPENVMIDGRGNARLMDFGIASVSGAQRTADVTELRIGTPAYMAPEQLRDGTASELTDVYALGVLLFELFTGQRPFQASSLSELSRLHAEEPPPTPSTLLPQIDPAVERVVLQCLEKVPSLRPQSVREVDTALPGVDPVGDALAAGATPAPELVAAAEKPGVLGLARAWAGLLITLLMLALYVEMTPDTALLGRLGNARSPTALAERARQILADEGWLVADAGAARGFRLDWNHLIETGRRNRSTTRWRALVERRPTLLFWWRQEPASESEATPTPGEALVVLDHEGHLVELRVVPSASALAAPAAEPDWASLIERAGLRMTDLEAVDPTFVPPSFADARASWAGDPVGPADPVRLEAAAVAGRPVFFRRSSPSSEAPSPERRLWTRSQVGAAGRALVTLVPLLVAGWLARKNLRLGRGDRVGARRLAGAVFLIGLLERLLRGETLVSFDGFRFDVSGLAEAFLSGALAWLLYLAAEPYVRRRWPQALVAWARLLSGRFTDPLVGRDVLLGILVGSTVCVALATLRLESTALLMPPMMPLLPTVSALSSTSALLGVILGQAVAAVAFGLGLLVALVFLRALVRNELLAMALALLLVLVPYAAFSVNQPLPFILLHAIVLSLPALLLRRAGLLAFTAFYFSFNLLFNLVGSCDWSTWLGRHSLVPVLLLAGMAGWGFWRALGDRPLFGRELLPD
jgi:serine/threonine-protein kinase